VILVHIVTDSDNHVFQNAYARSIAWQVSKVGGISAAVLLRPTHENHNRRILRRLIGDRGRASFLQRTVDYLVNDIVVG
jgi:hypothetical protein